jgi:hypothetical protein
VFKNLKNYDSGDDYFLKKFCAPGSKKVGELDIEKIDLNFL